MQKEPTWLSRMRAELGLTQADVATAIGVSERTVLNWENGHHEPKLTIKQVKALCLLLKTPIEKVPDTFPLEYPLPEQQKDA